MDELQKKEEESGLIYLEIFSQIKDLNEFSSQIPKSFKTSLARDESLKKMINKLNALGLRINAYQELRLFMESNNYRNDKMDAEWKAVKRVRKVVTTASKALQKTGCAKTLKK